MEKHGAQSYTTGEVSTRTPLTRRYASPWPDEVPGLGSRHIGHFTRCDNCARGTWVRYGAWAFCLACADLGKLPSGPLVPVCRPPSNE
jgi:hypothetical protein